MTGSLENIFQLSKVARLGGGGGWGGGEEGCSPPKFWATEIFCVARENLGKASS